MASRAAIFGYAVAGALIALPAAAQDSEGMPQLNTAHFPEQIFWLAVTFAILFLCMQFIALPGVKKTQDRRAKAMGEELAAATAANEEAKAMMAQIEKSLSEARANAQTTVNDIKAEAARDAAARQAAQSKELSQRLHAAEAKIRAARDTAIKEAQRSAADLSGVILDKILGLKA